MKSSICTIATLLVVSLSWWTSAVDAGNNTIEADPAKSYPLTKNRGPWMIMVATLNTPDEDEKPAAEGETPQQSAHNLVIELRKLGMPAYTYEFDPGEQHVVSNDRFGREERRTNRRRMKSISVLAGNYNDINDKLAQDSLAWVKKLKPKCFLEGVHYQPTPGRPGALSGAFLTTNPLLSTSDIQQKQSTDPLLVKINSGEQYSLFENRGQYTLVIARFYGKHMMVSQKDEESAISKYFTKDNVSLDAAAESARELVAVLRSSFDKEETQFNNVDAYIWHDHHESIVTVGSFSSPNDPAAAKYLQRFGPSMKAVGNGSLNFQPQHLGVSGFGPKADQNRLWLFEPNPELMKVPQQR
ncbi:hypothetical protein [Planctomicrobium piriforme]|uniref:Uncharacterized protein n=1 Tax=Planctomicrobium piriforme TaxID=1576369 RepID=A0A1I3SA06_9PLAN|nr:hypothetical protein [Planctomicrobium piriforme]SFJ54371.1 hypothetical protein SAMN05421753_12338 [Planctomicrobium piriforme]